MKTILYEKHLALGAKLIDFGDWQMPLQYQGIIQEHHAVRHRVGIFDVSHMGCIFIEGKDAESYLDYLSTNEIKGKGPSKAVYTVWCTETGASVDDLIVYCQDAFRYFVVVNAANRQKDLKHMQQHATGFNVSIKEKFDEYGILAIQGPKAKGLIGEIFPAAAALKPMHLIEIPYQKQMIILSTTGYTGSGGFEIFAPINLIEGLWDLILEKGQGCGIEPIGLGARDTLRLEMGYALYGHEINESIAPTESVSAWTVNLSKEKFIGKEALLKLEASQQKRSEVGLILIDPGIARESYEVLSDGKQIGKITSGGYSPTLERSIAIALTEKTLQPGEIVEVKIRKNLCKAQVVKLPFKELK